MASGPDADLGSEGALPPSLSINQTWSCRKDARTHADLFALSNNFSFRQVIGSNSNRFTIRCKNEGCTCEAVFSVRTTQCVLVKLNLNHGDACLDHRSNPTVRTLMATPQVKAMIASDEKDLSARNLASKFRTPLTSQTSSRVEKRMKRAQAAVYDEDLKILVHYAVEAVKKRPEFVFAFQFTVQSSSSAEEVVKLTLGGGHIAPPELIGPDSRLNKSRFKSMVIISDIARSLGEHLEVLSADATHMSRDDGITMFTVNSIIAGKVFPLVMGFASTEDGANWETVICETLTHIPALASRRRAWITDRDKEVLLALNRRPDCIHPVHCLLHLYRNVSQDSVCGSPTLPLDLFFNAALAKKPATHIAAMNIIEADYPKAAAYLREISTNCWVRYAIAEEGICTLGYSNNSFTDSENHQMNCNGAREATMVDVIPILYEQQGLVIQNIMTELEKTVSDYLTPAAAKMFASNKVLEDAAKYEVCSAFAGAIQVRFSGALSNSDKKQEDLAVVRPTLVPGQDGTPDWENFSCDRCAGPIVFGMPCTHTHCVITHKKLLAPSHSYYERYFHPLHRHAYVKDLVDSLPAPYIIQKESIEGRFNIKPPLPSSRKRGRPKGSKGKERNEKRILSRGENEANKGKRNLFRTLKS